MGLVMDLLDFKDVRIIPNTPTRINSRSECNTEVQLPGCKLAAPFIVPPMHSLWTRDLSDTLEDNEYLAIAPRNVLIDVKWFKRHNTLAVNSSIDNALFWADYLNSLGVLNTILSIEVANGHMKKLGDKVKEIKDIYPDLNIYAGTVCTPDGVDYLKNAGADVILIGIGVGSSCITTPMTGVGLPALATVTICVQAGHPIILTGGLREPGDVAKAIGAGASAVYVGALVKGAMDLAAPDFYWGEASEKQKGSRASHIEGKIESVNSKQKTTLEILNELKGHLQSSMSYSDAYTIQEFQKNCLFGKVS